MSIINDESRLFITNNLTRSVSGRVTLIFAVNLFKVTIVEKVETYFLKRKSE